MPTELPTGTVTFLFTDVEGSTRLLSRDDRAVSPGGYTIVTGTWKVVRGTGYEGYLATPDVPAD